VLGITNVNYLAGDHSLAIVDSTLAMTSAAKARLENSRQSKSQDDNFSFTPKSLTVKAGNVVTRYMDEFPITS